MKKDISTRQDMADPLFETTDKLFEGEKALAAKTKASHIAHDAA